MGDTLGSLRLVKKKIKSMEEILREQGLKIVPDSYEFRDGETVVIISEGEWEGETGYIASTQNDTASKLVTVILDSVCDGPTSDLPLLPPIEFNRNDIAIWDYPFESNWENGQVDIVEARSVSDGRSQLNK